MAGIYYGEDVAALLAERRARSSSPRLAFIALFLSLVFHFVALAWYATAPTNPVQLSVPKSSPLRISLIAATKPVEPADPVIPDTPSITQPPEPEQKTLESITPVAHVPDNISPPENLQTVIQRSSTMPDRYRLTEDDIAPPVSHSQADNVFDTRLRERLNAARNQRTGRVFTSNDTTTIHGETVVMLDEERCLSSNGDHDNVTRASDWYFTRCTSGKTEGELMMERVNQRIRARR